MSCGGGCLALEAAGGAPGADDLRRGEADATAGHVVVLDRSPEAESYQRPLAPEHWRRDEAFSQVVWSTPDEREPADVGEDRHGVRQGARGGSGRGAQDGIGVTGQRSPPPWSACPSA
ncbi:hypothetical protein [Umezawaea sp. Da 62-37]|uniref:hypothetical protein n=1 Tax=Umezawaea sp. Da 62-37 TaxID=3075927 RepID=UPI0028F70C85|nr:hypothetical protein [Umezawaea sp. Da 62-37]WNV86976.1 hypothetical protein RM788_01410 [Umezawaea sp. Da 62-37]